MTGPSGSYGSTERVLAQGVRDVDADVLRELLKVSARPDVLSLAGGAPAADLFDLPGIKAAIQTVTASSTLAAALQYGGSEGTPALRAELVSLMAERGVETHEEQLVVTTGSSQGIDFIGRVLLDPGDGLAVCSPTFLATITMARLARARVVEIPADDSGQIDLTATEEAFRTQAPRVLYLTPTFSNPSGSTLSTERRLRLLELAVEHDVVLVEDDPYGELHFDARPPQTIYGLRTLVPGAEHLCVYLGSLSKVMAPGLRLGWMIASKPIVDKAAMVKQVADAHTSSFDQHVATAYLQSGRLDQRLPLVRAEYSRRAGQLADALSAVVPAETMSFEAPRGGMFLWCTLHHAAAEAVTAACLRKSLAVVPGEPFFASRRHGDHLRLSFSQLTAPQAREAASRLAEALTEVRR